MYPKRYNRGISCTLKGTIEAYPIDNNYGDRAFHFRSNGSLLNYHPLKGVDSHFSDRCISRGYEFHGTGKKENILTYDKGIDGYYIVNGASPRGFKRGHSVVYYKGKLVHDPFIGGDGLSDFWGFFMIEKKRV